MSQGENPKPQISEQQLQANRENATKSTGPQTVLGKETVSRNATKHGLASRSLTFETEEERTEYEKLYADFYDEFAPKTKFETMALDDFVVSLWKQQLAERFAMLELRSRTRAAAAILKACAACSGINLTPISDNHDEASNVGNSGWECRELVVRVGDQTLGLTSSLLEVNKDRPQVHFEAKLANSAELFLRYESVWKKDKYKAAELLIRLQESRRAQNGEADLRNKAK
jgi:hypothetical protein